MAAHRGFLGTACTGLVLLAVAAAGLVAGRLTAPVDSSGQLLAALNRADNSARGKSLSFATGFIDAQEGIEALYALDHLTGDLHCWILNSHNGAVASAFTVSAGRDLEATAEPDFVMTTGLMDFVGIEGNVRPAHSVVYVGDGNTGKVVGYVLMFNRGSISRNEQSPGELRRVAEMVTRDLNQFRDQGK